MWPSLLLATPCMPHTLDRLKVCTVSFSFSPSTIARTEFTSRSAGRRNDKRAGNATGRIHNNSTKKGEALAHSETLAKPEKDFEGSANHLLRHWGGAQQAEEDAVTVGRATQMSIGSIPYTTQHIQLFHASSTHTPRHSSAYINVSRDTANTNTTES